MDRQKYCSTAATGGAGEATTAATSGSSPGQPSGGSSSLNAGGSSVNVSTTPGTSPATAGNAGGAGSSSSSGAAAASSTAAAQGFALKPIYVLIFGLIFVGGVVFASMSLQLTSGLGFGEALTKVSACLCMLPHALACGRQSSCCCALRCDALLHNACYHHSCCSCSCCCCHYLNTHCPAPPQLTHRLCAASHAAWPSASCSSSPHACSWCDLC